MSLSLAAVKKDKQNWLLILQKRQNYHCPLLLDWNKKDKNISKAYRTDTTVVAVVYLFPTIDYLSTYIYLSIKHSLLLISLSDWLINKVSNMSRRSARN